MTVQVNHISDTLISVLQATPFIPTFVVTIFHGWRVVTCSWEVGGRIYAISEGGIVVSLDYPLCHVELRLVSISSADAFGMDADRIEFRFWSAADRLDVACSSCSVPPSWLVVSRVSGLKVTEASSSNTPLLDKENAEKARWAVRLEAIGRRAGAEAKLFTRDDQSEDLSTAEMAKLKQLVLISGAPRTMAAHIRSFERFEIFLSMQGTACYPISIDKVLKYTLDLDKRDCGQSVIPAFKTALKWVASRLAIDLPDLDDRRLRSLQESVVVKRAKVLKEAVPIPIEICWRP